MKILPSLLLIICTTIPSLVFGQGESNVFTEEQFNEEGFWDKIRISVYLDPRYNPQSDYEFYLFQGIRDMEDGEYEKAVQNFRRAEEIKTLFKGDNFKTKDYPAPNFLIGACKVILSQPDSAKIYYERAIKNNESLLGAYNEMAFLSLSKGKIESAKDYFKKALIIDKNNPITLYNYGLFYYLIGLKSYAKDYLNLSIKHSANYEQPYIILSIIYLEEEERYLANNYIGKVLGINPKSPYGLLIRGLIAMSFGKYDVANVDFYNLYKTDTTNYFSQSIYGITEIELNNFHAGVGLLAKAIQKRNNENIHCRVDGFNIIEFQSLVLDLYNNKFSDGERKVAHQILKKYLLGEINEGSRIAKKYLKYNPNSTYIKRFLVLCKAKERKYSKIENLLDSLILRDSSLVNHFFLKGLFELSSNRIDECISKFTYVTEKKPNYALPFYYKGEALHIKNDYEQAIENYSKAIDLYDQDEDFYYSRSLSYSKVNSKGKEIADIKKAISINPIVIFYYAKLAQLYYEIERYDSAYHYISNAINLNPFRARNYVLSAKLCRMNSQYELALNDINIALRLTPNLDIALFEKGEWYYDNAQYYTAIKYISRAIRKTPTNASFYKKRGHAFYQTKRFKKALKDFKKVNSLTDADSDLLLLIGDCHRELKDYNVAIEKYNQAISMDSTNALAYESMGIVYYRLGEYERSIDFSLKAFQLKNTLVNSMYTVALSKFMQKDFSEAKRLFQFSLKIDKSLFKHYRYNVIDELKRFIKSGISPEEAKEILKDVFGIP
jgi:tetratricopeptide (TPR) repeat protein